MTRTTTFIKFLTAVAVCMATVTTHAALMEIEFTGLDLVYDGTDISDAGDTAGGEGDPADSDELTAIVFSLDGTVVGTLSDDIFADILIPDVEIDASGGTSSSTGSEGIFDLLTSASIPGFGLALDIDAFDITYTGSSIAVFGNGMATEVAQDLPFGLAIVPGDTVTVSFSTQVDTLSDDGTVVTSFTSSGTGEIRANAIPEPTSLLMTLLGLLAMGTAGLRYRWG